MKRAGLSGASSYSPDLFGSPHAGHGYPGAEGGGHGLGRAEDP